MKTKILVTVKTYPSLSTKYTETVCTAGLKKDGAWIRLYPIPFRLLEKTQRFCKYQWISADIERDTRDPRHESHRLCGAITPLNTIDTKDGWKKRRKLVLRKVYMSLSQLITEARDINLYTSLAVFKPAQILRFHLEKIPMSQTQLKKKRRIGKREPNLADLVPYRFYYTFVDANGRRSRLQITDWEIYQLCRKLIRKYGNRKAVIYEHLKKTYFDKMLTEREIYFFLGTTRHWHIRRSKNPFMIIGIFYPPKLNLS